MIGARAQTLARERRSDHNIIAMENEAFDQALVGAAFELAAAEGWSRVSVARAAQRAELPLGHARARFPVRAVILARFGRMADQSALSPKLEGSVRDRLFDLLMRRFDALQAHREGVLAVLRALPCDPPLALFLGLATQRSMRWMLDAAGVSTEGPLAKLRVHGLTAVWMQALRAWRTDKSPDLTSTMAALDRALKRAEQAACWLQRGARTGTEAAPETPSEEPPPPPPPPAPSGESPPPGPAAPEGPSPLP
jgi:ubiquinone biosynthesis protein COQ9